MNEREQELIRDYLDNRITPDGLERLNQLLEIDADARAEFRAMATLEEGLRDLAIVSEFTYPKHEAVEQKHVPPRRSKRSYRVKHFGVAALCVACLVLVVLLSRRDDHEKKWGDAIAEIEFLSSDAAFSAEHQLPDTEGSLLGKGWLRLERGHARILFRSGAMVDLEGPASLGIDTSMRSYLDFGMVSVYAPESARDFVVATESMEVVDLGTKFEISVNAQSHESKVSVIEGLVDLHLGSRGAERMIRPLEAGYAARVDASGRIIEITNGSRGRTVPVGDNAQLLAHWTFDGINNDGRIKDSTNQHLDGILRAPEHTKLVSGVSGQALSFEHRNVSVDLCEHVGAFAELDAFTFATWVRDPDHRLAVLFSLSGESEQHRVQFYVTSRFVRFGWQDGLHFDSISGRVDAWNAGSWHHVAVTAKDGIVRLYRDGELVASGSMGSKIGTPVSTLSTVRDASHAYLGRLEDGRQGIESSHQWFKGKMDDAQLYSGAVSQEGIQFMFENPGIPWSAGESHE